MSQQEQVEEELEHRLRRGDNEEIRAFLRCAGEILLSQREMPLLGPQLDAALLAVFSCSSSALGDVEANLEDIIANTQNTPESFLLSALSWTLSAQRRLLNKKHGELAHHATTRAAHYFAQANPQFAVQLLNAVEAVQ